MTFAAVCCAIVAASSPRGLQAMMDRCQCAERRRATDQHAYKRNLAHPEPSMAHGCLAVILHRQINGKSMLQVRMLTWHPWHRHHSTT